MEFSLNFKTISSSFPLPCDVADKYIKLASGEQLKVLILAMRDLSEKIDPQSIADKLSISKTDAEDALLFWVRCGILEREDSVPESTGKKVVISSELPTRTDVIMRGMEDDRVRLLLREAQLKFGRNLKNNESRLLVSLYDDYGMDVTTAKTPEHPAKDGVQTVRDAEEEISRQVRGKLAFGVVRRAFGIEQRIPSEKENEFSNLWVNEWGMSPEMLKAAYDVCIDQKAKISFPYIGKVLEKWHTAGYKTVEEVKNGEKKPSVNKKGKSNDFAGFDLDAFEAKLNSD